VFWTLIKPGEWAQKDWAIFHGRKVHAMRINQNIMSINASRTLSATSTQLGKSLEKLSSGSRINRAADDASGLVVSQKLRAQLSGLNQAIRNSQDGVSVVQTAEGALTEVHAMLTRMRELAVQAANVGGNDADARTAAKTEIDQLAAEITRISDTTKFGATNLLDGSYSGDFQVGALAGESINVAVADVDATALGVDALLVDTAANASTTITAIDAAIDTVSSERQTLGAAQNRFESIVNNLAVTVENLTAAESRVRDTDMAKEMANFTKNQILAQAGTAMLAQANQAPQNVLRLLQ
jgi:flagellin